MQQKRSLPFWRQRTTRPDAERDESSPPLTYFLRIYFSIIPQFTND
jgi:hypothetical protein